MSDTVHRSTPSWLTKEFFGKIFNDFVSSTKNLEKPVDWDCEIDPLAKVFDDAVTTVFKVKVTNKVNVKEFFKAYVKIMASERSALWSMPIEIRKNICIREYQIYNECISEFLAIFKKIDSRVTLPTAYHLGLDPYILVIEDMVTSGYDRYRRCLSVEECKKVFEDLGKFHAVSYFVHHELKKDLSKFDNVITLDFLRNTGILKLSYQMFTEVVATWEGCSEFAEKLKEFEPFYYTSIIEALSENPSGFNVLNHGDFDRPNYLKNKNKNQNGAFVS
ncbi:uncharacterized protein LOC129801117 [Phlebotomus papatasi]|uniref:uncharacterized protein LOC129801117 n=1 Tax=Phlebotomus papatasi TaxID=29031 RepID=UPI00248348EF|nr:uncharacterized protein LOC129801117 [Phlebotomus papatasi]